MVEVTSPVATILMKYIMSLESITPLDIDSKCVRVLKKLKIPPIVPVNPEDIISNNRWKNRDIIRAIRKATI